MSYTKQPPFTQEILHEQDSPFTLYNRCFFHQKVIEAKNSGINKEVYTEEIFIFFAFRPTQSKVTCSLEYFNVGNNSGKM